MNTVKIEFDVVPTSPDLPLNLCVQLNGKTVWQADSIAESKHVVVDVNEDVDSDQTLHWIVSGKKPDYTKVDDQGNISSDSMLKIQNFTLDDIDLTDYLHQVATYTHDFNGTGTQTTGKMYPDLGCNGTAEMKFSTPVYMWLLENI